VAVVAVLPFRDRRRDHCSYTGDSGGSPRGCCSPFFFLGTLSQRQNPAMQTYLQAKQQPLRWSRSGRKARHRRSAVPRGEAHASRKKTPARAAILFLFFLWRHNNN
jgi:hypothetical protein